MNQAQDVVLMSMKTPRDVRERLEQWASDNLNAEVIRSVRERAERERAMRDITTDNAHV